MMNSRSPFTVHPSHIPFAFLLLPFILLYCSLPQKHVDSDQDLIPYVNPFIGTKNMGHTYPGATAPFGMVQLSPETNFQPMYDEDGNYNRDTYKYCSGYQYDDNTIFGFSHTHFSGTGHSDLGDFLVMPTVGELKLDPGKADEPGLQTDGVVMHIGIDQHSFHLPFSGKQQMIGPDIMPGDDVIIRPDQREKAHCAPDEIKGVVTNGIH